MKYNIKFTLHLTKVLPDLFFPANRVRNILALVRRKKKQVFEDGLSLKSLVVILVLIFGT